MSAADRSRFARRSTREFVSQRPDGPSQHWVHRVRSNFRERFQHKQSLVHAWVGERERIGLEDEVPEEKQIQIDRTRGVADRANTPKRSFNLEKCPEQGARIKLGAQFRRRVEEWGGAGRAVDRVCLEGRRDSCHADAGRQIKQPDRLCEVGRAVADVRSHCDVRLLCHGVIIFEIGADWTFGGFSKTGR